MFVCVLDVLWPGRIGFSEIYNYGIQLSLFIFLFKDVKLRLFKKKKEKKTYDVLHEICEKFEKIMQKKL